MAGTVKLFVAPDGDLRFVYRDELLALMGLGRADVCRASHVEPRMAFRNGNPFDVFVEWTADMAPSGGPVLGPFVTRQEALDAENSWLNAHLFLVARRIP